MRPVPQRYVPYPPIGRHGVIGDRRCAALVAADGTLDWLCLPDYDSAPLFGALLDAPAGGHWRFGPRAALFGEQRYLGPSAVLQTRWTLAEGELELTDFMPWRNDEAALDPTTRVVARRLRCTAGRAAAAMDFAPRSDFAATPPSAARLSTTFPESGHAELALTQGQEEWAILTWGEAEPVAAAAAARALDATLAAWTRFRSRLTWPGLGDERALRSALTIHLLGYAPSGAMVAAPTCSLPERLGGDRNYDYRYAWIRDASLCVARFCLLGDLQTAERFLSWLCGLGSSTPSPLQVAYGVRGELELVERQRCELAGYRSSRPVLFGNRAYQQRQLGSLGYLADAMRDFVAAGGSWRPQYAQLLAAIADHTCRVWREPDSGIWELAEHHQYVSSKVMSWTTLDRALAVAERCAGSASDEQRRRWTAERANIAADVLEHGWSDALGAFRERYGADGLDAAALLIPIMGLLPADDARVRATVDRIGEVLSIAGFLYRWDPERGTERGQPLGEFEGSFVPLMFWWATALAKAGRRSEAEVVLARGEEAMNALGLFAEEYDPRDRAALGNFPLLFSHAEHLRAKMALAPTR